MAAAAVLVDSSFYIGLARNGRDPLQALAYAAVDRDLVVCGVVRCEVGRGVRQQKILKQLQSFWDVMLNVPTDNQLWSQVEELGWRLDRQGTTLPLTDLIIASCAMRIDAAVLTFDRHFELIPGLRCIDRIGD
ncbi:MAG: PIN domain-containing protein [Limisphaerales bacterium]